MSANTAELTLILKAKNLADMEIAKLKGSLSSVGVTAGVVAKDMKNAFKGIGRRIGQAMGNIAQDVLSGGSLTKDMLYLGATLAGGAIEGLSAHLIPGILAKIAGTAAWATVSAALASVGTMMGGVLAKAIALGTAALPVLLTAVVVAAATIAITEAMKKAPLFTPGPGNPVIPQYGGNNPYKNLPGVPHAAGGWVGLHGPEMAMLGERGPEYVVPNHQLGQSKAVEGVRIMGVSEQQILDMVDRGLYFRLQRAAPTPQRT